MKLMPICLSLLLLPVISVFAQKDAPGETYTSLDPGSRGNGGESFPPGLLKFTDADLNQVLNTYRELSQRSIVRSSALPAAKISLETHTALTRIEALQALDSVLAQNGIVMIPQGAKFVKAVARQVAAQECPPLVNLPPDQLPDCGTYIAYIVEVKNRRPRDLAQALQPFAGMPNSILGLDDASLLVLRDFSSNVRRMLQVLERIDKVPPPDKPEKPEKGKPGKAKP